MVRLSVLTPNRGPKAPSAVEHNNLARQSLDPGPVDPRTPIVGIFPNSPAETEGIRRGLLQAGIHPPFIRYLTARSGFYRFAVLADHTPTEVKTLAAALAGW